MGVPARRPAARMANDRNGVQLVAGGQPGRGRLVVGLSVALGLVALIEWAFALPTSPPGWPRGLLVLPPLAAAAGLVLRVDRRHELLLGWALGFVSLAVLFLVWPAPAGDEERGPAPWLALLAAALGVGAHVGGRRWDAGLLARSLGGLLVALSLMSADAMWGDLRPGAPVLGLGGTLAFLGVGGWLMARDLVPGPMRIPRLCMGLLAGLALLVLAGWWLRQPYMVQGGTDLVPMQFNTAICALLLTGALRLLSAGQRNLALLPLVPVLVIAVASLLEEYAGLSLGSGQWLLRQGLVAEGMAPGQMAPNTATAFLVACLGVLLAPPGRDGSAARWSATWACGFVITIIALIVLIGYLLQVPVLRGWGAYTPMALMTAFTLLLAGLALGFSGMEFRRDAGQRANWVPVVVAGAAIGVSLMVWYWMDRDQARQRDHLIQRQAQLVEQALAAGTADRYAAMARMGERLGALPDAAAREAMFDLDSRIYLRDFESLVTLVWTGQDRVARRQHGRASESVRVVGRPIDFDPVRRQVFEQAEATGRVAESPPLVLLDGALGELLVAPIPGSRGVEGFVVAVVRYDALFGRILETAAPDNPLVLRFGDQVLFARGEASPGALPLRQKLPGAGATLELLIWPEPGRAPPLANMLVFTLLATGGLVALALRLAGLARERAEVAEQQGGELARQVQAAEQARQALEEAEQELSSVFTSISDAFYTLDPDWRFVFVNPKSLQLMQRERGQLVGQVVWEVFPDTRGTVVEDAFRTAVREQRSMEFEYFSPPLDHWFYARCYPHPHGLAVYFQDITDRKHAEQAARQAQAASLRAKKLARLGSWELDLGTGLMTLSPEAQAIFALGPGRSISTAADWMKCVHFEDRPRLEQARRQLLDQSGGDVEVEYRILRPDGEIRQVREQGTLLLDATGAPVAASGAIQDTTERHQAENALRELSRRLEQSLVMNRLVLENSLDVICVLDANGRFTQVSSASQAVWGYPPGELVGRAFYDIAHPDDRGITLREGASVLAGRPTVDFRNRVLRPDGRVVTIQWSAVWSARDRMIFAIARDVTEAARQAEALREATDALERAQRIARMGAWELDIAANALTWSEEVYRIFEVSPEEFAGTFEAFAARVLPEDLATLQAAQATALAGEGDLDVEHRIILPGGRVGYVHERGRLLRDDQGRPWKLAGSVQDISERRRAKVALEQERSFLKAVLESLSEGVVACDAEGRLTLFNHATRDLHGLPESALGPEQWAEHYSLYQPDGVTPMAMEDIPLYRALRGEVVREVEMLIAPKGRPQRLVLCSGRRIIAESGEILGAVVAMHDITRRKRAQQLEEGQRLVLAGIAARRPLGDTLMAIVRLAERQAPDGLGSILLLDDAGEHVRVGAAPSLPPEYNAAIHGQPIGPKAGSCGTAAYRGERVIVSDIDNDPLWDDYRQLVQPHGLKACWSTPVKAQDGRVLATFATYYREVREPTAEELELIDGLTALCAVAVEHDAAFQSITAGQQRFRSLFDEHPDVVYSLDLEGRFTEVNERFQQVAGMSPQDIIGRMFDERVLESEREVVRAHFTAATRGEARSYEMTGVSVDGQRVELRVSNLPIVVDGRVTGVFGIAQDISLLRKHQRELSDALDAAENVSRQLHKLSEASISVNADLDEGTLYQQLVDRAREIIGAHQAVVSVEAPDGASQLLNAVSLSDKYAHYRDYNVPIDGTGIYVMVGEHQQPMRMTQEELESHPRWRGFGSEAGRHPPMRGWLAVPMVGSDGKTLGILQLSDKYQGEFNEDDEQVAVQFSQMAVIAIERARLLAKLQVRDRFFEMSLEVFVVYDPATARWVQVNQMLADITGYSREELCSRPILDFVHPEDRERTRDRSRDLGEQRSVSTSFVNRYLRRDGGVRWMEWMSAPAPDGLVYAVGRDITERLQQDATLRQTLADLNARNRELQDFALIASHDLQEPLRKIRAFSDRLQQRHAAQLADEARDYLDRTSQAAGRMQVLIDDLLAYSRVSARGKPFSRVDLQAVMAGVVEDLETALEASGGRVEVEHLPTIDADRTQMRQLFQNLLSNALKFRSPGRPPLIRVEARARDGEDGLEWTLLFEDNGIGFEPRYAAKVFAPFQRLHARQQFDGTGIGLAIVRRIVERHRGSIEAEGRPGEGAIFTIRLPARQPSEPGGLAGPMQDP